MQFGSVTLIPGKDKKTVHRRRPLQMRSLEYGTSWTAVTDGRDAVLPRQGGEEAIRRKPCWVDRQNSALRTAIALASAA